MSDAAQEVLGTSGQPADTLIEIKGLETYFHLDEGVLKAVDGIDLTIRKGETLGLVGESGCGKSVAARSVMRIVPAPGKSDGQIAFAASTDNGAGNEIDLLKLAPSGAEMRAIRGRDITMIFQEPMTSFSPLHTIGNQIEEAILLHRTQDPKEAREIALDMITKVGISNPIQRIDEYPHQLSGGMRQRAMIAMALSCNPSLLIADEPTTALDVTVQAQVIALMLGLREEYGMAMLYITHDLGVIAEIADRIAVMYLGKIIETGNAEDIFYRPSHPYTRALLESVPVMGRKSGERLAAIEGTVPVPINLPDRCGFAPRCKHFVEGICDVAPPELTEAGEGHLVRCFRSSDL